MDQRCGHIGFLLLVWVYIYLTYKQVLYQLNKGFTLQADKGDSEDICFDLRPHGFSNSSICSVTPRQIIGNRVH